MIDQCPIFFWKKHTPYAKAFANLTYRDFDLLIQKLCGNMASIKEEVLAFAPKNTPLDIALFFATWRLGKAAYPLSHKLPQKAIEERLQLTKAKLIQPTLAAVPLELSSIDPTRLSTLIETSSASKIACHCLNSHIISAQKVSSAIAISPSSKVCLALPLNHIAGLGLMMRTFLCGATLLFSDEAELATHLSLVPTQLLRLLKKTPRFPHLESLLIGGSTLSPSLYKEAINQKLPLKVSYGMTEACSTIAIKSSKTTTILPHIELKFSPDREILIRGPSLLSHYWGQEPFIKNSWFPTGDIGQFNDKKELIIIGRKDRQFISGGENIQPEELEKACLQHPEVLDASVEPIAHPEFGMCPKATLYCTDNVSLEMIESFLEETLPRYKIPKEITLTTTQLQSAKMKKLAWESL